MKSNKVKVRKNRLKKNMREQRARWLKRMLMGLKVSAMVVLLFGVSTLFVMAYTAVTAADYFRTRAVNVIGNSRLSTAEVLTQAGVRPGANILALNLRLARERLLDHAWIESARVTREIPHTLTIEIIEQVPLARIDWGRQFLLNTGGTIFKEAAADDPADIPLITGLDAVDIALSPNGPAMQAAVQVLQLGLNTASAIRYADMERLQVDPEAGITVILRDRRRIKLGLGEYDLKFGRLEQLRRHLENGRNPREFVLADLTDLDRVVVRLKKDVTGG